MEILRLDPKLMKCKFIVLPIKLYPLYIKKALAFILCNHKIHTSNSYIITITIY